MIRPVGLVGHAGSGKSEAAAWLCRRHGFIRVPFAGALKDMLRAGFDLGADDVDGAGKEIPCDRLCGITPRAAMQTLGTEWGRRLIHPDLWIATWKRRAADLADFYRGARGVVAEDVRFGNEAAAVRDLGGAIWRIIRPGVKTGTHVSETEQAGITADVAIANDGSLDDLAARLEVLLPPEEP